MAGVSHSGTRGGRRLKRYCRNLRPSKRNHRARWCASASLSCAKNWRHWSAASLCRSGRHPLQSPSGPSTQSGGMVDSTALARMRRISSSDTPAANETSVPPRLRTATISPPNPNIALRFWMSVNTSCPAPLLASYAQPLPHVCRHTNRGRCRLDRNGPARGAICRRS